jgi:hypothetical protein
MVIDLQSPMSRVVEEFGWDRPGTYCASAN